MTDTMLARFEKAIRKIRFSSWDVEGSRLSWRSFVWTERQLVRQQTSNATQVPFHHPADRGDAPCAY